MKLLRFIPFLLVGVLGLTGCSSDNEPNSQDPIEKPNYDNLKEDILGDWVSMDQEGKWNRIQFEHNESGSLRFFWLTSESINSNTPFKAGYGSWNLTDDNLKLSYERDSNFKDVEAIRINDGYSEFGLQFSFTSEDGLETSLDFNKILVSYFAEPGAVQNLSLNSLVGSSEIISIESPDPEIAEASPDGNEIRINGTGTTYIRVTTSNGIALIEVTGSEIVQVPSDIVGIMGAIGRWNEAQGHEYEINWVNPEVSEILERTYDYFTLKYYYSSISNTLRVLDSIYLSFDSKITYYSVWQMAKRFGAEASVNSRWIEGVKYYYVLFESEKEDRDVYGALSLQTPTLALQYLGTTL